MLRFKQYIFESTSHDLSQAHAVFAMTSKRVTAARQQQSKDALAKLQQALADGQIYNADFNELKQTLAYNLERVEDGSGFKIWSQVEYAQSNRGVYFMRMPTRFTDVKLADGSMMKMPSEEKMITSF